MSRTLTIALVIFVGLLHTASARAQSGTKPLGIGETAPDFTLVDQQGRKVTLSDSRGKNPVVVVFYRGYW